MATKWFCVLVVILAASPIRAVLAESDEDRWSEDRAIELFMNGCVHFGPAPTKRPYWLRDKAGMLPLKIEAKGILWAYRPQDVAVMVLNADDGLCSVMLMDVDAEGLAVSVPKAFEKAGLPLQLLSRQPPAGVVTNDRYRTAIEGLPFEVLVTVITPASRSRSPKLQAVLAFKPKR